MTRQMNILLVEDNKLDAMFFTRAVAKVAPSARIVHAEDGLKALEILQSAEQEILVPRPFFILLDINMPRMNGHEFLRNLRKLEGECDSVVFMFTTSDSALDVSEAYKNKVNGYIVKPQDSKGLKRILGMLQEFWSICETPVDSGLNLQAP